VKWAFWALFCEEFLPEQSFQFLLKSVHI